MWGYQGLEGIILWFSGTVAAGTLGRSQIRVITGSSRRNIWRSTVQWLPIKGSCQAVPQGLGRPCWSGRSMTDCGYSPGLCAAGIEVSRKAPGSTALSKR